MLFCLRVPGNQRLPDGAANRVVVKARPQTRSPVSLRQFILPAAQMLIDSSVPSIYFASLPIVTENTLGDESPRSGGPILGVIYPERVEAVSVRGQDARQREYGGQESVGEDLTWTG